MNRWVVAVFAAVLLTACAGTEGASSPSPSAASAASADLEGATWVLDQASAEAMSTTAPPEARVDLTFEAAGAHGLAACNTYRGSYTLDGSSLTFGEMATTMMACEPEVSDLEAAYLAKLGAVTSYSPDGGQLTLSGGDGPDITFSAESPASLTGTDWNATMVGSADALSGVIAGTQPTAKFDEAGSVTGTDGCNRYHADYATEGDSLTVGKLASTLVACESDVSGQAKDFKAAMGGATTFALDGATLTIYGADGRILLMFSNQVTGSP
jgi:heat shock protein HslJ